MPATVTATATATATRSLAPRLGWQYSAIFIGFISFTFIAVVNIVTAVFVESMMLRSQNDREFVVQMEMNQKKARRRGFPSGIIR
jgi:hypothetical protein